MNNRIIIYISKSIAVLSVLCALNFRFFNPTLAQTTPPLISPHYGTETITQNYSTSHKAIDIGMSYEPVLAAFSGTVEDVSWFDSNCHWSATNSACGFGLYIRLNYTNSSYRTYYAHLSATGFGLGAPGTSVSAGQFLGTREQLVGRPMVKIHLDLGHICTLRLEVMQLHMSTRLALIYELMVNMPIQVVLSPRR